MSFLDEEQELLYDQGWIDFFSSREWGVFCAWMENEIKKWHYLSEKVPPSASEVILRNQGRVAAFREILSESFPQNLRRFEHAEK